VITADTITNADLIRLHEEIRYDMERLLAMLSHCERALGTGVFSEHLIKISRARCAEILNARAKELP
jgi:hypothetical protein